MSNATLINRFEVPQDQDEQFLALWGQADELLRTRGGYLTTRLHKALMPGTRYRYVNTAELDSVETWQAVITSPEFAAISDRMRPFNPTPGLFAVAVAHTRQEQAAQRWLGRSQRNAAHGDRGAGSAPPVMPRPARAGAALQEEIVADATRRHADRLRLRGRRARGWRPPGSVTTRCLAAGAW